MKVIENFLEKNDYLKLKELISNINFPWRIRTHMVEPGETYKNNHNQVDFLNIKQESKNDNTYYFTYNFFNDFICHSEHFENYIIPIMRKLNAKAIVQIRSNFYLNKLFEKSDLHIDNNADVNCKTAILNFTTCDGGTEFLVNDELKFVESVENKIVIFNSNILHRTVASKTTSARIILNMNYFD